MCYGPSWSPDGCVVPLKSGTTLYRTGIIKKLVDIRKVGEIKPFSLYSYLNNLTCLYWRHDDNGICYFTSDGQPH